MTANLITKGEWTGWTIEQVQEIINAPCDMKYQPPFDFAYCETHDTTFALGDVCHFKEKMEGWQPQ